MDIEVKAVRKNVSVHDYLIDHSGFDWAELLSGWGWLSSPGVHRLADEQIRRSVPDPAEMAVSTCWTSELVRSPSWLRIRDDFASKIDEDDHAEDWLMIPLVDRLVAAGVLLKPGECYSFLTPPILGGDYSG